MNTKLLTTGIAVGVLLVLAGCTGSGLPPDEAVNGSEAITEASVYTNESGSYISLTLADPVEKANKSCVYIHRPPQLGGGYEECDYVWHNVSVDSVSVVQLNGTFTSNTSVQNGERVVFSVPFESATYRFFIHSDSGLKTYVQFAVTAENGTVAFETGGYDDTY